MREEFAARRSRAIGIGLDSFGWGGAGIKMHRGQVS